MCEPNQAEHVQVPFVTVTGEHTTVDEDIYEVISMLNELGVRTQYSCQGGFQPAYVCADRRSFGRFIRAMRRTAGKQLYSPDAKRFANKVLRGSREQYFHYTLKNGNDITRVILSNPNSEFTLEQSYSNVFGLRTVIRWPEEATTDFYALLLETRI